MTTPKQSIIIELEDHIMFLEQQKRVLIHAAEAALKRDKGWKQQLTDMVAYAKRGWTR